MTILGIDPGIATTGYALITAEKGNIQGIRWGCITTPPHDHTAMRLHALHEQLREVITTYRPHRAAIEKLFFYNNAKTAMVVGEARGVILMTLHAMKLPILELTPLEVKRAVTGSGAADKKQMQKMLTLLFKLEEPPQPDDAADALAIAYCGVSGAYAMP